MKFTLSWLKEHLDTEASLDAIAGRLTAIGLEVDGIDDKAAMRPFRIARVLSAGRPREVLPGGFRMLSACRRF